MPAITAKTAHTAAARYLQHHSHISPIRSKIPIAIRQIVTEIGNIIFSPFLFFYWYYTISITACQEVSGKYIVYNARQIIDEKIVYNILNRNTARGVSSRAVQNFAYRAIKRKPPYRGQVALYRGSLAMVLSLQSVARSHFI